MSIDGENLDRILREEFEKSSKHDNNCIFHISIDLPTYAKKTLKFLETIYNFSKKFNTEPSFYNSYIDKYLKFIYLKHKYPHLKLIPTLEVEWIWFSHLIRPVYYHKFCKRYFGGLIDHTIDDWYLGEEDPVLLHETARVFEAEWREKYFYEELPPSSADPIKFMETVDILNDWSWYERIMEIEDFPNEKFMEKAYNGYLKFLRSVTISGASQLGPPVNIDLFWHTHQIFPKIYQDDCVAMFGDVVYHMPLGTVAKWKDFITHLKIPGENMLKYTTNRRNVFKIAVLGVQGVGKSAFIIQQTQGQFIKDFDPSIEDTFRIMLVMNDDEEYLLDIVDTSGSTDNNEKYIRSSHGVILMYSVADRNSFNNIKIIKEKLENKLANLSCVLVGNKCDTSGERQVPETEGISLAKSWNIPFFEASALANVNVSNIFEHIIKEMRIKHPQNSCNKGNCHVI